MLALTTGGESQGWSAPAPFSRGRNREQAPHSDSSVSSLFHYPLTAFTIHGLRKTVQYWRELLTGEKNAHRGQGSGGGDRGQGIFFRWAFPPSSPPPPPPRNHAGPTEKDQDALRHVLPFKIGKRRETKIRPKKETFNLHMNHLKHSGTS